MKAVQSVTHSRFVLAVIRWFDSHAGKTASQEEHIDWVRCMPFFAMHLLCLGVFWVGFSWTAFAAAVALYVVRMFAVTGIYHRYFSHKTYKTSRGFQFAGAVLGATAVQRGPLWWSAHHRHHHAHSDEEDDFHSPHSHGFLWSHMLWLTSKSNFKTDLKAVPDLAKFPELVFLDRFDFLVPVLFAISMFLLGMLLETFVPGLGTNGLQMLVWGFFISTIVLFHGTCTINSLAHLMGRKRFKTRDESRNSFLLAIITLGEGWHNNHHHYPASVRQGFYWWELDITYMVLVFLSWTGLIWNLQPVPARVKVRGRISGEHGAEQQST